MIVAQLDPAPRCSPCRIMPPSRTVKGRIVHDGPLEQLDARPPGDRSSSRQISASSARHSPRAAAPCSWGSLPRPVARGHAVPGVGGAVDDPADEPLQIDDVRRATAQLLPLSTVSSTSSSTASRRAADLAGRRCRGCSIQLRSMRACPWRCLVLSSTHSRLPSLLLAPQGLGQLQVAPGGEIQLA